MNKNWLNELPAAVTLQMISALITEFAYRVDSGRGNTIQDLFFADGTLETPHAKLKSREEIHAFFSEHARGGDRLSRHHWTNLRITSAGNSAWRAECNSLVMIGAVPAPFAGGSITAGITDDVLAMSDEGLKFKSRKLDVVMSGTLNAPEQQP